MGASDQEPPRPFRGAWADFCRVLLLAAPAVGCLGFVRLARQFPGAMSSPGLLSPFLLPVVALALETGALVALSAALLRELERARLRGLSRGARARATLPLLALLGLSLLAAESVPRGTERPGAFANELVRTARGACGDSAGEVQIPLLGLSVSCGGAGRIHGPMPGVRAVSVNMRELTFTDDLRGIHIRGLELVANRALSVRLVADTARIAGLSPWSRSPRLSLLARFVALFGVGLVLWGAANVLWPGPADPVAAADDFRREPRKLKPAHSWLLSLAHALPGAVAGGVFILLDQERVAPVVYAAVAAPGVLALGALRLLVTRYPKLLSPFNGF